jgi:hypothetical protein
MKSLGILGLAAAMAFAAPVPASAEDVQAEVDLDDPYTEELTILTASQPEIAIVRALAVDYDIVTAFDQSGSMRAAPDAIYEHLNSLAAAVGQSGFTDLLVEGEQRTSRLEFYAFAGRVERLTDPVAITADRQGIVLMVSQLSQQARNGVLPALRRKTGTDMALAVAHGMGLLLDPDRGKADRRILNIVTDIDPARLGRVVELAALRQRAAETGISINVLHIGSSPQLVEPYFRRLIANGFVLRAEDFPTFEAAYAAKFRLDIAASAVPARCDCGG